MKNAWKDVTSDELQEVIDQLETVNCAAHAKVRYALFDVLAEKIKEEELAEARAEIAKIDAEIAKIESKYEWDEDPDLKAEVQPLIDRRMAIEEKAILESIKEALGKDVEWR